MKMTADKEFIEALDKVRMRSLNTTGKVNIDTVMEVTAKIYSKDADVAIKFGQNFCTAGKTIWIPSIPDYADPLVIFNTEVGVLHEIGHILYTKLFWTFKDPALLNILNALEDVRIERLMFERFPGIFPKQDLFVRTIVRHDINKRFAGVTPESLIARVLDLAYLRAKEIQLETSFNMIVPKVMTEMFDWLIGEENINTVASTKKEEEIVRISQEIYEKLKKMAAAQPTPPPQQGKQNGKEDEQGDEGSGDSEGGDSESVEGEGSSDGEGDNDQSPSGDTDSSGSDSSPSKSKGKKKKNSSGKGTTEDVDSGTQPENGGSDTPDEVVTKKQIEQAQEMLEKLSDEKLQSLQEQAQALVNEYAEKNCIYREANGLKDTFYRQPTNGDIGFYENYGKALLGYLGAQLASLFTSQQAPVTTRHLRKGKLDVRSIWNDNSNAIYKKKIPGIKEDAAVFMVMDNSGSMSEAASPATKSCVASALMITLAAELDKLRVPFAAAGFTSDDTYSPLNAQGIRTQPAIIQIIKTFDEPYRRVMGRFSWPSNSNLTVELPTIKYGAEQLMLRNETKKIMFILSDGGTYSGHSILDAALRVATKDYVLRLKRAGFYVIGFSIFDKSLAGIVPDTIHIDAKSLGDLPRKLFTELTRILLK